MTNLSTYSILFCSKVNCWKLLSLQNRNYKKRSKPIVGFRPQSPFVWKTIRNLKNRYLDTGNSSFRNCYTCDIRTNSHWHLKRKTTHCFAVKLEFLSARSKSSVEIGGRIYFCMNRILVEGCLIRPSGAWSLRSQIWSWASHEQTTGL